MEAPPEIPKRFADLPVRELFGVGFPVAMTVPARLRGLSFLDHGAAGPGLVIPRCRSVHTIGMRFPIDVHFLDREGDCLSVHRSVGPGWFVTDRRATCVLESIPGLIEAEARQENRSGGREKACRD